MKVLPLSAFRLRSLAPGPFGLSALSLNPLNPRAVRRLGGVHDLRAPAVLLRATALELAILAGHVLLYPTGLTAEHPDHRPAPLPDGTEADDPATGADPLPPPADPPGGADHPPVVMLHGFADNRSVFVLLRRSLSRHGWRHLECLNYSPLTYDIRAAAGLLGRHLEEIGDRTGSREVDIVGHSLGGLIARYYIQCLGGDLRVRTLVTLGTPHSGTTVAPLASAHPVVRQMRPDSGVIEELRGPAPGCRTRFVSFWSDLDQMMIPIETARIEHPDLITENVQVSGIGHLAMPVHPAVVAGIRQALGAPCPADSADPAHPVAEVATVAQSTTKPSN
ncbi:lipase [Streptomyces inusitatus]|uniref:Lipase n=1 Tax=Streptomyces inusitatus TaxID=68221 RepID=A0A918ULS7_9ACTN|nr:alpha/beta fold hydrolase [Streptomyces inusitatus]GGZ19302.1 lipase [Streptomyces inusitatus]